MPRSKPPLVGKLYKDDIIKRIGVDKPFAQRIFALALHRDELSHAIPFATWPRRILFKHKDPPNAQQAVIGFTMERLVGTTPLYELITQKQARLKVTHSVTAYLCITLADQLARNHPDAIAFLDEYETRRQSKDAAEQIMMNILGGILGGSVNR